MADFVNFLVPAATTAINTYTSTFTSSYKHSVADTRTTTVMAFRSSTPPLLLLALLLFCVIAQASSDVKIDESENEDSQMKVVKGPNRRLLPFVDCGRMCQMRCSLHSRQNVCTRACGTCCARCKCVPPGTSGNREACGTCYTDMRTHGNKPKCP